MTRTLWNSRSAKLTPIFLNEALEQGVAGITLGIGTNAPPGAAVDTEIENRAQDISTKIKTVQATIAAIPSSMMAQTFEIPTDSAGQTELAANLFKDLDTMVGGALSADLDLGPMVEGRIKEMVKDGKPITTDMLQDLIGDLEGVGEAQLEAIKRSIEVQNKFLQDMDKINTAIIAQQQKFADALAKVTEVSERAADRMSDAREGGRVSTSADIRANRQGRERGRRTAAGQRLGPDARGAGAIAGDVAATSAALKALQAEASANAEAARNATDPLEKSKFNENAKRAAQGAKNAAAELERLSDQSARAADIQQELNQIRKGRKQIGAQVERFAFGSDDERKKQGEEFGDLQLAIGQGGIQGATEDQRANVGSILDALADVENVGGTGKTGRQLKAEFAEKEAIAQGMDPAIAKQIGQAAAAGPREEALLNELAALGREEKAAALAIAKNTETQIGVLQEIRDKLGTNFVIDINMGQQQAATQDDSAAQDAADDALKKANDAAVKAVNDTAAAWKKADKKLRRFQKELANTTTALKELQDNTGERREAVTEQRADDFEGSREEATANAVDRAIKEAQNVQGSDSYGPGGNEANEQVRQQAINARMAAGANREDATKHVDERAARYSADEEYGGKKEIADMDRDERREGLKQMMEATVVLAAKGVDTTQADGGAADFAKLLAARDQAVEAMLNKIDSMSDEEKGDTQLSAVMGQFGGVMKEVFQPIVNEMMKAQNAEANPLARGGMVYRAGGGSIFQPKGTDTVPAMLTPGEFVIRKSAVDKIGVGNLAAMNNGMSVGGVVYRAGGWSCGSSGCRVFHGGVCSEYRSEESRKGHSCT